MEVRPGDSVGEERDCGMISAKSIKPGKLNDKAMRQVIEGEAVRVADDIEKDFKRTTKTWKRKVKFVKIVALGKDRIEILVGSDDEIYRYVNEGTKAHVILPKRFLRLRFKGTFTSKTVPGVIDARSGGSSGSDVYSTGVIHPGTQARNFDDAITKLWKTRMKRRLEKAMREAVKVSGHRI